MSNDGDDVKDRAPVVHVGDVLAIPLSDDEVGVGYVVAEYGEAYAFYVMLYPKTYPSTDAIDERATGDTPVMYGLTYDSKVFVGHWTVVGNVPPDVTALPLPAAKVGMRGETWVEDYTGSQRRIATAEERELLRFRTVVAPMRLEKALRAYAGLAEWSPVFDEMRVPDPPLQSRTYFEPLAS